MTLQELTDQIRLKATHADGLDATIKLATDQGPIFIDARQSPAVVTNDDSPADTTITVTVADLMKLGTGDMNPMMAFMTGKLKVQGDMGVAMKMGQIMG
ncbi:MAG: SCP2 sterol-binding domain-containing protein [Rudanella sp.]|nr:SCP2 sterol-binding domain-containing protein [Rudanella sp.]